MVRLLKQKLSAIKNTTVAGLTSQRLQGSSFTMPSPLTGSANLTIEDLMINQAKFNTAVQLGNTPILIRLLLIVARFLTYWTASGMVMQNLLLSPVFIWIRQVIIMKKNFD